MWVFAMRVKSFRASRLSCLSPQSVPANCTQLRKLCVNPLSCSGQGGPQDDLGQWWGHCQAAWLFAGRLKPLRAFWALCLSPLSWLVSCIQGEASAFSCVFAVGGAVLWLVCSHGRESVFACRCQWFGRSDRLLIMVIGLGAVLPTMGIGCLKLLKVPNLLG